MNYLSFFFSRIVLILIYLNISSPASLTGKFLHLTDIHYDPYYTVNSSSNCLSGKIGLGCCRKNNLYLKPHKNASKWGDYNCDTPYLFINKTFEWIKLNLEPLDFIIYTGDSIDHHDFTQSIENNIKSINDINNLFKYHFPNTKVYSTIGNHDTYPIDQTPYYSNKLFLNNFAISWSYWLGNTSNTTIINGGYYNNDFNTNLTILSFNSLYYDSKNLFEFSSKEGNTQMVWLKNKLQSIKDNNGIVWIINHICPYHNEANKDYSEKFIDIVSEYKEIIKYQFYGHTHSDLFTLFKKNDSIVGFGSIPSSIMLDQHEASFRIYDYNRNTFDILNYHQYSSNLEKIIEKNTIIYNKTYSFNEEYDLKGVNLKTYKLLYEKLINDDVLLDKYYNHINPIKKNRICNKDCKKKIKKKLLPD